MEAGALEILEGARCYWMLLVQISIMTRKGT